MTAPRAVIAHLGRDAAMGEARRVRSWCRVLEAAGIEAVVLRLIVGRPSVRAVARNLGSVATGAAVPETLAWSPGEAARRIARERPDLLICVTARAYHPELLASAPTVVLDYVDRLSVSYGDRARLAGSRRWRFAYRVLAAAHRHAEGRRIEGVHRVAAGWSDAQALDAVWVPVVVAAPPEPLAGNADVDVLFVGTLRYPPNEEALERLAHIWPQVLHRRAGTTALVAGSAPTERVRRLVRENGWELLADFDDMRVPYSRSRLAVAPMVHTAGIQNKVLDAAAMGVAQVATPAAVAGLEAGFPVTVARDDDAFAAAVVELLDDPARRDREAGAARSHVVERYSAAAWAGWARSLLGLG